MVYAPGRREDVTGRGADGMPRRRVDLQEAAEVLGTSVDAVRERIQRGTLRSEKADGKVYVWLDDSAPRSDIDTLISEMRAHNETLLGQLEAERQAHAEARRLLAAALERIPEIEPPRETPSDEPEARVTRSEPVPNTERSPETGRGGERPWRQRIFGGRHP